MQMNYNFYKCMCTTDVHQYFSAWFSSHPRLHPEGRRYACCQSPSTTKCETDVPLACGKEEPRISTYKHAKYRKLQKLKQETSRRQWKEKLNLVTAKQKQAFRVDSWCSSWQYELFLCALITEEKHSSWSLVHRDQARSTLDEQDDGRNENWGDVHHHHQHPSETNPHICRSSKQRNCADSKREREEMQTSWNVVRWKLQDNTPNYLEVQYSFSTAGSSKIRLHFLYTLKYDQHPWGLKWSCYFKVHVIPWGLPVLLVLASCSHLFWPFIEYLYAESNRSCTHDYVSYCTCSPAHMHPSPQEFITQEGAIHYGPARSKIPSSHHSQAFGQCVRSDIWKFWSTAMHAWSKDSLVWNDAMTEFCLTRPHVLKKPRVLCYELLISCYTPCMKMLICTLFA